MKKQKPSEVISGFLSFLGQMNVEHMECTKTVETCSQKNIDYLMIWNLPKIKMQGIELQRRYITIRLSDGRKRTGQWRLNILQSFSRIRITGHLSDR